MKLSVVIPCLNGAATIANQLTAFSEQQLPQSWEIVVADNGSTDGTWDLVRSYRDRLPNLRIVDASDRPGSAHARNVGARHARGDSLVFCDADDQIGEGWLRAISDALESHDFVASRMDFKKLNPFWLAQSLRNPQDSELQKISYPPYLAHAGGSGLGVKRALHEKVGGFDESLPQLEDTDYCFRIELLGTTLHFVPDAVIHIRHKTDPRSLFRQARLWAEYNSLMYKRYGDNVRLPHAWRRYFATCRDLMRCAPRAFHKQTRSAWIKTLGTQIGLLQGAIRFRVPPLR